MGRVLRLVLATVLLGGLTVACGGGSETAGSGAERTVLVDYKHDQFASAFLRYYPEKVAVRQGDTVRFKQAWTGEPHSVTMGKVVDGMFADGEILEKYDSAEEALADGITQEKIDEILANMSRIPGMVGDGYEVYQPGAQPCFVADLDDAPLFSDPKTEENIPNAKCPTAGEPQPEFTGRQALYNSGFINPEGDDANTFTLPVAKDAEPGTYRYYCNYHWVSMSGEVEVVDAAGKIPSQQEVNKQARSEIAADAKTPLQRVSEARESKGGKIGDLAIPLAGRQSDDEYAVVINEFLPNDFEVKAGKPVTWTFDGISHTVSFNVPKYFPVFTVADDGKVGLPA